MLCIGATPECNCSTVRIPYYILLAKANSCVHICRFLNKDSRTELSFFFCTKNMDCIWEVRPEAHHQAKAIIIIMKSSACTHERLHYVRYKMVSWKLHYCGVRNSGEALTHTRHMTIIEVEWFSCVCEWLAKKKYKVRPVRLFRYFNGAPEW